MAKIDFANFDGLESLDDEAKALLMSTAHAALIPPGRPVFSMGSACENYLLVINGSVRVQMVSQNGREIVLYRVGRGQTCIMTTACLMSHDDYSAEAITETEVNAVMVPAATFHRLIDSSAVFRHFVFSSYSTRLSDLLMLVDEVAFRRIDVRVAKFLLDHQDAQGRLKITHQAVAAELGSAREVISRQLKEFEIQGWVKLARGQVDVIDAQALASVV